MRVFLQITLFILVFMLNGCMFKSEKAVNDPDVILRDVSISLDSDANLDSAVSVDLVVAYSKDLLDTLMSMSSKDYFDSFQQIARDHPENIDIWHWELTPGQLLKHYPIVTKAKEIVGAIVFADYKTPGDHRIRLGSHESIKIRMKKEDFCVLEMGCSADLNKRSVHKLTKAQKRNKEAETMEAQMKKQSQQSKESDENSDNNSDKKTKDDQDEASKTLKQAKSIFDKMKKMTKK